MVQCRFASFGQIEIDGRRYDHDVVIEEGHVRRRKKGPSKRQRGDYGHTPLSADEAIPWSAPRLVVGTGATGQLPITDDLYREAGLRNVEVVARPTAEACELLTAADARSVSAPPRDLLGRRTSNSRSWVRGRARVYSRSPRRSHSARGRSASASVR
jgi:hypothetical protein